MIEMMQNTDSDAIQDTDVLNFSHFAEFASDGRVIEIENALYFILFQLLKNINTDKFKIETAVMLNRILSSINIINGSNKIIIRQNAYNL